MTATEATDLMKQAFLDAAASEEFQISSGKAASDTRIAILTGLTRKEIDRLRIESDGSAAGTNLSQIGRLIAGWNQDPDFTGPYGLPLGVKFSADPGSETLDFCELVRRHTGDVSAKEMLDELLRTGLAHVDEDGLIRNSGRTYIPSNLDPAAIERLGKTVSRLSETLDFNNQVNESSLRRFERNVTTDIGLTEEQLRHFKTYLRTKCQELLETIDNWLATQEGRLTAHEESVGPISKKLVMTGVGVYHFLDDDEPGEFEGTNIGSDKEDDDDYS